MVLGRHKNGCSTKAGFTLMEILIVVAVVAVLVAIAIPVFSNALEKSRESYDVYTMRQAASAACDLYYSGVKDKESAEAAGLSWTGNGGNERHNAYGAYDPSNGTIYPSRDKLPSSAKMYGKGTAENGETTFEMGNPNGAYAPDQDYTTAVVMVSIYPDANEPHVDVYWKNNVPGRNTTYVGGQQSTDIPKYSIRVFL